MDLRQGILGTAAELGVSPQDIATIISYETAGTFDPKKAGPTTQWGQHRGLIQWGEPQAKKYGVDWNNPIASQLGKDGAVVRYMRNAGVKPGMGILDLYSAVNAGQVGRYNASDANNGGAPGTVRDKVQNQMSGHREKALTLLGGAGDSTVMGSEGMDTMQEKPEQRGLLFNMLGPKAQEYMTRDRVARLQMALEGMTLNPNQGVIQAAKSTLEETSQNRSRNKTVDWLRQNGRDDLAQAVESGAVDGKTAAGIAMQRPEQQKGVVVNGQLVDPITGELIGDYRDAEKPEPKGYIVTGEEAEKLGLDPNNSYNVFQEGGVTKASQIGGGGVTVNTGSEVGAIPQGYELVTDPETGARRLNPIEGSKAATEALRADKLDASSDYQAELSVQLIDDVLNSSDLAGVTGIIQGRMPARTQGQQDLLVKIEQLQGKAFLNAFESLKGGGAITEREGIAAQNAMARLQRAQSEEAYRAALKELRSIFAKAATRQGGKASEPAASSDPLGLR